MVNNDTNVYGKTSLNLKFELNTLTDVLTVGAGAPYAGSGIVSCAEWYDFTSDNLPTNCMSSYVSHSTPYTCLYCYIVETNDATND